MLTRMSTLARICAAGLALHAAGVAAQSYPNQNLRLVVPFAAGGSTDAIARIVAERLSDSLGRQVLVDNKPGAAGAIGADNVAKAKPDGYTLLLATSSTHAVLPVLSTNLPYAQKDFAAITLLAKAPNVLAASPHIKANNVKELIALGKSQPGKLSFASSGIGAITHLVGERFRAEAGIDVVHVPYKTGVQALADLVSGQVSYVFDSIVWTLPQIRAGKLKGLAVTTLHRSPLAPELPTVAETLPGFEGITWFGLVVPAGTPADIVTRLNQEVGKALADSDVKDRFAKQGIEAAQGTAEEFNTLIQTDTAKWRDLVRKTGVKIE